MIGNNIVMADTIKNPSNRVDRSANGTFLAFWREQMVYEHGGSSGSKQNVRLGNTSLGAIWQAKSYIKLLIGAAVLLLQSVDGGIIAIWATVAIHR